MRVKSSLTNSQKILIVDDEPGIVKVLQAGLKRDGYYPLAASSGKEAVETLSTTAVDLILLDLRLGKGINGFQTMQKIRETGSRTPIIMMTAYGNIETAVRALKAGACDFICKPFSLDDLRHLIREALQKRSLDSAAFSEPSDDSEESTGVQCHFGYLIGESPEMRRVYRLIERSAPTDATVLIQGESGTGKELVARALHKHSRRADRPWVPLNCAAVPVSLLESEMFGHTSGAFTGARFERQGLFISASGGTLFLDEIGVMNLGLQGKLLRALQEGKVRRIGENQDTDVDVRVIAATNEKLEDKIQDGSFRTDLYYRVNVIPIELPPLRERGGDIVILAEEFKNQQSRKLGKEFRLAPCAINAIINYSWPGNVRELQNAVACAATLCDQYTIEVSDLPPHIAECGEENPMTVQETISAEDRAQADGEHQAPLDQYLKQKEREYIRKILQKTGGNRLQAAEILGISRTTLYRKYENC